MTVDQLDPLKDALDDLHVVVGKLTRTPVPTGGAAADAFGAVRRAEVDLADWRRGLLSEQDEPAEGIGYKIVEERKAARSFAVSPIMKSVMDAEGTLDGYRVLRELLAEGAVRLSWQWTALSKFFAKRGITMSIANHEIEDEGVADAPHVGQVWRSSWRVVAREEV